jgi:hypothetical protein
MALEINSIIEESFKETEYEKTSKNEVLTEDMKLGGSLRAIAEGKGFEVSDKMSGRKLNIDLEVVQETQDIQNMDQIYSEDTISKLASAFAVERLIDETIVENIMTSIENIEEAQGVLKNVVRYGQIKPKLFCPPGFKADQGKCVKMTAQEVMARRKAAKLAIRTRARTYSSNKMQIQKSRAKSMKVREKKASVVAKTKMAG